jgi:hypothetical protein
MNTIQDRRMITGKKVRLKKKILCYILSRTFESSINYCAFSLSRCFPIDVHGCCFVWIFISFQIRLFSSCSFLRQCLLARFLSAHVISEFPLDASD